MIDCLRSVVIFLKTGGDGYLPIGGFLLYSFYITAIIVGISQLAIFIYSVYEFVNKHFFREKHDLLKRYANSEVGKAWAVVTGCTSGIGAGYALELARLGFNIALVGRSQSKLEISEKILKQANSKIKTRIVQADFSNTSRPKERDVLSFYDNLKNQLDDLDIAILVNNAGVMYTGLISKGGPLNH